MKKTIITVDDSISVRQVISAILVDAGYKVLSYSNGPDALVKLQRMHADLLLVDYNMPQMNGIELVKEARSIESYKYTPIVMVTTECGKALKQKAKTVGVTGWIVKPVNPDKLLAAVKRTVG